MRNKCETEIKESVVDVLFFVVILAIFFGLWIITPM